MPTTLNPKILIGFLFAFALSFLVTASVLAGSDHLVTRPATFEQQTSIEVSSALGSSQTTVSTGQEFTLSFTLRNTGSAPVTLSHVLAAGRDSTVCPNAYCQDGKVDFPVETNRVINPGETFSYERSASIGQVGAYFFQIAYAVNNDWTIVDPKLDIAVERGLEVEEGLTVTPETIVAGSAITARFALRNYGSQPVVLDRLFVGGRDISLCSNLSCQQGKSDIHIEDNVTIAAGESKSFEAASSVAEAGTYFFQITYEQNGIWTNVGDQPEVIVTRGLEIVSPLVLTPSQILSGEAATASFTLKNFSTEPIQIRRMLAAGRPKTSECQEIYDCFEQRVDFDLEEGTDKLGFTMMPGEEKFYQKGRIMGEPGTFFFQVSFQIGDESVGQDENWFNIGEQKDLVVTPGLLLADPLAISPVPVEKNRQLRAEFTLENQGDKTFEYQKVGVGVWRCVEIEEEDECEKELFSYEFFENVVIEPGTRFRFVEGRSFPVDGEYFARISVQSSLDDSWAEIGAEIPFDVINVGENFSDAARDKELTLGVHFHPQWNDSDFDRLELAAEAGFEIVRIGPSWRKLEPYDKGEYDPEAIAELDAVVNKAIELKMDVYLMFAQTPCWASSDPAKNCNRQGPENHGEYNDWYPATNYDDYADAFVKIVELFSGRVDTFEVWNEPNRKQFWPPYANAAEYTEMLKAVHREVSSRYPNVTILGGSLAGADVVYLEDMYQAGAKGTFDKLAMHPYANADAPDECSNSRWAFLCGIKELRHKMEQNEDSTPIWFTEFGWSTYDGDRGVSEQAQLENFQSALGILDNLGYVEVATWYNLIEGGAGEGAGDEVNSFGLFRESYETKPAADWLISLNEGNGSVAPDAGIEVLPVWPDEHDTVSEVMQGGTLYRYFQLIDGQNVPISEAMLNFSNGLTATSDKDGNFTLVVDADSLGGMGSYLIRGLEATYAGQTVSLEEDLAFGVEVTARESEHFWSFGALTEGGFGVSTGLVAYINLETNGGFELTLVERDSQNENDDVVLMKEFGSVELAGEVGVGFDIEVEYGVISGDIDILKATTGAGVRSFHALEQQFDNPYAESQKQEQGYFLVYALLTDKENLVPELRPILTAIVLAALNDPDFNQNLAASEIGIGTRFSPVDVETGINVKLPFGDGKQDIGINILELDTAIGSSFSTVTYPDERSQRNQISTAFDLDSLDNWGAFETNLSNLFAHGKVANTYINERFYDKENQDLKRFEVTLKDWGALAPPQGSPRPEVKWVFTGDALDVPFIQNAQRLDITKNMEHLLGGPGQHDYIASLEMSGENTFKFVPRIPGTEIKLGGGIMVKSGRKFVNKEGMYVNGRDFLVARYQDDEYVNSAGKDWGELSSNALDGLWSLIKDKFSIVTETLQQGVDTVIEVGANLIDGAQRGFARLFIGQNADVYHAGFSHEPPGAETEISAMAWVPSQNGQLQSASTNSMDLVAAGSGFVVGGIYSFQPYTLTIASGARLEIEYTDEEVEGIDESQIQMFRWNESGVNWQPITATSDVEINTLTTEITELGIFAVGIDRTDPTIIVIQPSDEDVMQEGSVLVQATLSDYGVGIDPDTVVLMLDNIAVNARYDIYSGELLYISESPLSAGSHTLSLEVADTSGNVASVNHVIRVESMSSNLYLPFAVR